MKILKTCLCVQETNGQFQSISSNSSSQSPNPLSPIAFLGFANRGVFPDPNRKACTDDAVMQNGPTGL